MFKYAVGRAEFTFQILRAFRDAIGNPLFQRDDIKIAAIGGGPASELPGILKYIENSDSGEKIKSLQFDVYDKETAWQSVGELVAHSLNKSVILKPQYFELDLGDAPACAAVNFANYDAVILSFVISEICCLPNTATIKKNLASILNTMSVGSFVIYNDSKAYSFYSCMNSIRKLGSGLNELYEIDGTIEIDSPDLTGVFGEMITTYGITPHLKSQAVAKYLVRN
jgi:hypothetical protein